MRKELLRHWQSFCEYTKETNKRYVDDDFSFENFMHYLEMMERWEAK